MAALMSQVGMKYQVYIFGFCMILPFQKQECLCPVSALICVGGGEKPMQTWHSFYRVLKTSDCFTSLLWQDYVHTGLSIIGRIRRVIFADIYLGSFCVGQDRLSL